MQSCLVQFGRASERLEDVWGNIKIRNVVNDPVQDHSAPQRFDITGLMHIRSAVDSVVPVAGLIFEEN